jgi:hypothetical protein
MSLNLATSPLIRNPGSESSQNLLASTKSHNSFSGGAQLSGSSSANLLAGLGLTTIRSSLDLLEQDGNRIGASNSRPTSGGAARASVIKAKLTASLYGKDMLMKEKL